ncbi:hypothetical protein GCM10010524_33440 [Streptomyces mexicanus]
MLMEPGTFAVDPDPWGPPRRDGADAGPDEAAARGIHAPYFALSTGAPGALVTVPGDIRGTALTRACRTATRRPRLPPCRSVTRTDECDLIRPGVITHSSDSPSFPSAALRYGSWRVPPVVGTGT